MRASKVAVVGAALVLAAAMSVVPLQVAGAQSPSTSVLVPLEWGDAVRIDVP